MKITRNITIELLKLIKLLEQARSQGGETITISSGTLFVPELGNLVIISNEYQM